MQDDVDDVAGESGRGEKQADELVERIDFLMDATSAEDIPIEFICPITGEIMVEPFRWPDGQNYERYAMERWLITGHSISPITRQKLRFEEGRPNRQLRRRIDRWCKEHSYELPAPEPQVVKVERADDGLCLAMAAVVVGLVLHLGGTGLMMRVYSFVGICARERRGCAWANTRWLVLAHCVAGALLGGCGVLHACKCRWCGVLAGMVACLVVAVCVLIAIAVGLDGLASPGVAEWRGAWSTMVAGFCVATIAWFFELGLVVSAFHSRDRAQVQGNDDGESDAAERG